MNGTNLPFSNGLKNTFLESFNDQGDLHFSVVASQPLTKPVFVSINNLLCEELGLDPGRHIQ